MTITQKLQTKLQALMTERETTADRYWIDLEIEDLNETLWCYTTTENFIGF